MIGHGDDFGLRGGTGRGSLPLMHGDSWIQQRRKPVVRVTDRRFNGLDERLLIGELLKINITAAARGLTQQATDDVPRDVEIIERARRGDQRTLETLEVRIALAGG